MKNLSPSLVVLVTMMSSPLWAKPQEVYSGAICGIDDAQNYVSKHSPGVVSSSGGTVTFSAPGSYMRCATNGTAACEAADYSVEVELGGSPRVRTCGLVITGPAVNAFHHRVPLSQLDEPGRQAGCEKPNIMSALVLGPNAQRSVHCMADPGTSINEVKVTYGQDFSICPPPSP
jgi:hypothetical protein